MASTSDIPGMYYDPIKKKYFRITPGVEGSVFLTENDARIKSAQFKKRKRDDDLDCMNRRNRRRAVEDHFVLKLRGSEEQGHLNDRLSDNLMRYRLDNMKRCTQSSILLTDPFGNTNYSTTHSLQVTCSTMFAREEVNGDTMVYSSWDSHQGSSMFARFPLKTALSTRTPNITIDIIESLPPGNKINDVGSIVTEGGLSLVVSLHSRFQSYLAGERSTDLTVSFKDVHQEFGIRMPEVKMHMEFPGSYLSCCPGYKRFAIGGHKHIKMFTYNSASGSSILHGMMGYSSVDASSDVTALAFHRPCQCSEETILAAGTNQGRIHFYDLRGDKAVSHCRVGTKTICNLRQFGDNYWIVSGHENRLVMLDIRKLGDPLLIFRGHVNSCHRFQASVDEVCNLVTSAGDDCVTRTWSTSTGKLLQERTLPSNIDLKSGSLSHSWLLPSYGKDENYFKMLTMYGSSLIAYDRVVDS